VIVSEILRSCVFKEYTKVIYFITADQGMLLFDPNTLHQQVLAAQQVISLQEPEDEDEFRDVEDELTYIQNSGTRSAVSLL
jgi:hypothetical protein